MEVRPTPEPARSILVWGGGPVRAAQDHHAAGGEIVAWTGADTRALVGAGVTVRPLEAVVGEAGLAAVEGAARTWARLWGRLPLLDGRSFRDLVRWRDMSLLWLAEGFIRHETTGPRCARVAEMALRLLEATRADEVDVSGLGGLESVLISRACTAAGVLFHGPARGGRARRWRRRRHFLHDLFAPRSPPPLPPPLTRGEATPSRLLIVVVGPDVDSLVLRPLLEGVSAELGWSTTLLRTTDLEGRATRSARRAARQARARLQEFHGQLRGSPGLHQSYSHRGVGFSDLAAADIDQLLLGHLPEAVRRLEAAAELVSPEEESRTVLMSGCPQDDRRTLAAACGRVGVPSAVLHATPPGPEDVDRDDGGPRADIHLDWAPGAAVGPALARLRAIVKRG